jgi:hypothetical protein
MDGDDGSRYPAGFGIPAHMITDLESFCHLSRKITGIRIQTSTDHDFQSIREFPVLSGREYDLSPLYPVIYMMPGINIIVGEVSTFRDGPIYSGTS